MLQEPKASGHAGFSYPLRHVSIRVPWHDNGWNGSVCKGPKFNTACLKLKNISNTKDEDAEETVKGLSFQDLIDRNVRLPPCVDERATFMADFDFEWIKRHPYVESSPQHSHFRPTPFRHPAYALAALPFRWMMRNEVFGNPETGTAGFMDRFPLDEVNADLEPSLRFKTNWLQDHRNHRASLDCFWNHVRPERSLVFIYAKQVPFVEDTGRRVLIGVGRVKKIGGLTEYRYDGPPGDKLRSLLWERLVVHSIRPQFEDGFLMPYHEAMDRSDDGRAFDPAEAVAFAPEDRFVEFSYATEHVGNDAAIDALLAIRGALHRCSELFGYEADRFERWIDRELGRLWNKRGPFPGLGAVLSAMGVGMGNFIAQALLDQAGEQANLWPVWFKTLDDPDALLPPELARHIDGSIAMSWKRMDNGRRAFLELLSRMDLTQEQAALLVSPETRKEVGINPSDEEITQNPYLVYEATRFSREPVALGVVDRGMLPSTTLRTTFPVPRPSLVRTSVDVRRLRALTIRDLETAARKGDTLRSRDDVVRDLRRGSEAQGEQTAQITADVLGVAEDEVFEDEIRIVTMADGRPAYQLERLGKAGDLIRSTVVKRVSARRHRLDVNWRKALDKFLDKHEKALPDDPGGRKREDAARAEKTAALAELAASRFSVLLGRAGTGKTTLLSVLCAQPEISRDRVLLLAPTGKARVRMEDMARKAGIENWCACTLAQHLIRTDRYDPGTQRYRLTGERGEQVAKTVVVDECSMLTEEMMAALLESMSRVGRLIFVGDHRQLPPIGAGRPFVDIVARLKPEDSSIHAPHVAEGFAELTIPRRQGSGERDDLLLASWFGGGETSAGDDQVFEILSGKRKSRTVEFVSWETPEGLEEMLPEVLGRMLEFDRNREEWQAFDRSLGGEEWNGSIWFRAKYENRKGAGIAAEMWQILSPVRGKPWGVDRLNRVIQSRYRGQQLERARNPGRYRSIPKPKGDQQIIYGDKVINNRNWPVSKKRMFPKPDGNGYLANGEIGIVVGHRKTKSRSWMPKDLEIEFSTQRGTSFTFYDSDFKEEGEAGLELAYALTIHKAQGSEFEKVLLVLPRSPIMVTRELLYTALTRQKEKVIVLLQGSAADLHRFSSERHSAVACRLTNLFGPPKPIKFEDQFLEERLIHHTTRGDLVRSKSEVIIANLLHAENIDYEYEKQLVVDGVPHDKFPDFTIEDEDTGVKYVWEHLGMLGDRGYKRRWQEKERWYRDNGILAHDDGGGPNGVLIVTRDDPRGGIDSSSIRRLIEDIFKG